MTDAQLEALAAVTGAMARDPVYETLPASEKAAIDRALARLDDGQGEPWSDVCQRLRARIEATRL